MGARIQLIERKIGIVMAVEMNWAMRRNGMTLVGGVLVRLHGNVS